MSFALGWISEYDIEDFDVFNHQNSRTEEDIKDTFGDYNCMAYVFGAYEWLLPFDIWNENAGDIIDELGIGYDYDNRKLCKKIQDALDNGDYDFPILIKLAIERMLTTFPDLRRIKSFDELKDDEYGIVYAAGGGDFHFGKYEDEVWTHKKGNLEIQEVKCEDEVFGYRYDSKRFYFAMKKGEVRYEC